MLLVLVSWEADVMQVDAVVIVVGAGPTGLMLAGELALAGVAVEVLEKQTAPSGQSRGGGVNPRSAEVLAMRGLIDAVTDRAIPRENTGGHFAHLPVALDTRPWRTRYPGGLLIPQNRLEQVLEDHLAGLGITVRRGTELTGLDTAGDEGVTATVRSPSGQYRLRGRYVVACDGGHSTVRKLTGVAFPGRAGTLAAVSADIELTSRSATVPRLVDHISRLTCTGGGYWMLLHPLDHPAEDSGLYRVVFGGPEQAHLPREAPVSPGEVTRALAAVHGTQTQLGRLRWGTRFSDASRQVADYRVDRVIFAGDAAHIHSPIGGQGLNLGLQDAVNLGWKLAAHAHGDAPDGLLDSYHTERRPGDRDGAGADRADEPATGRRRPAGVARDRQRSGPAARRQPVPGRPDVRPGHPLRPGRSRSRSAARRPDARSGPAHHPGHHHTDQHATADRPRAAAPAR
jgi:2-polyprenyl-6-methoxyphenol hydroxylase-like FAD-dependent oxidoreductase